MRFGSLFEYGGVLSKLRTLFRARDVFIHDGAGMKRVRISSGVQLGGAGVGALAMIGAVFGVVQLTVGTTALSGAMSQFASRQGEVSKMEAELASLQSDLGAIRTTTTSYISKLEARQALLSAAIEGKAPTKSLAAAISPSGAPHSKAAVEFAAMFKGVEGDQGKLASIAQQRLDAKYSASLSAVSKLGVPPSVVSGQLAMGGPYEPVTAGAVAASIEPIAPGAQATVKSNGPADPQFRALFNSWRRLDQLQQGMASIPSVKPVDVVTFTSGFGVRSDPFGRGAAMHAGVDIPGAYATQIHATADGIVSRAGWVGGYGNMVELNHGRGIQTRYGHLSSILVAPGAKIKRGQLIALMGSTGRSTGTHLHYEVRVEGSAINPIPFLQSSDYLVALQSRGTPAVAVGGPIGGTK
jgi:murein DD-endopeptidase MepM/ murein hydrolase activator NlpD